MAFLALQAQKQHMHSVLVTSDKDVYQFLSDYISVWPSGGKDGFKGPEAAQEKFGVEQKFLPDYFAIVGVELIHTFGHLEDILRAAQNDDPRMKPALAKKLREQEGNALLSKQLVVLDPALDMPFDVNDYRVRLPDPAVLAEMFERYEFKNLLESFRPQAAHTPDFFAGEQKALPKCWTKPRRHRKCFYTAKMICFCFPFPKKNMPCCPWRTYSPGKPTR